MTKKRQRVVDLHGYGALLRTAVRHFGDDLDGLASFVESLPPQIVERMMADWWWQAHDGQKEPAGDWTVWLLKAGRGFGKTRAGAEWVSARARSLPDARIALVGGSRDEVAKVMIEGPSGLIKVARPDEPVKWTPSIGTVAFASGAKAFVYSAEAAEALRGPEHHFAWADELAKWSNADAAWDNLMMGLRLGELPRVVVTTTPKPVPLLNRVMALDGVEVSGGRTADNPHLPRAFVEWVRDTYAGTRLGRQELDGELIEDADGSLFPRALLERARTAAPGEDRLVRIVVGVDPPGSVHGTCGIVVCAADRDGLLHVLADASIAGASPDGWARAVTAVAGDWSADRVIAEKNQGGDMVRSVLENAEANLPVKLVSASRGKSARAEPVAALFERGRAKLAGRFPELEDELAGLLIGGGYAGPGTSPDRADACVWAMTTLMGLKQEPRLRRV